MPSDATLTVLVLVFTLVALARELFPPPVTIMGAVVLLLLLGVLSPAEAFGGFSNPAPITVAALYVLARAVERTGALQPLVAATLGKGRGRGALLRLVTPTAGASAFLNNTPIVAMLVSQVSEWAERRGQSPSRYLMPLSFAAILGGMVTTIGTSTNLVVSGLLEASGREPLGMFEMSRLGLPVALVGLLALTVFAPLLLPDRQAARRDLDEGYREFVVQMLVRERGAFDGKTVEEAGLRHLQGVFLVEVERVDGELVAPVTPKTRLLGGDRLTFVGKADLVVDLHGMRGLVSAAHEHTVELDQARHTFFEAVVGPASPLVGRTLKEVSFRARFQAAVMAIHRAGARVKAKLGDVPLKVGDTLVILADPAFRARYRDGSDFLLVSMLGGAPPVTTRRAWIVFGVGAGIVVAGAAGVMPILHLSLLGALLLVVTRVLEPWEARNAIDFNVIVVIAGAFGLGAAMEASGVATALATAMVELAGGLGPTGIVGAIVISTVLLTSIVTNNAAAVLLFPVALSAASRIGADLRTFAIVVAVSSSVSFLTPIAYQTNLMVYGPGGYRFTDYLRLGGVVTAATVLAILAVTAAA